MQLRRNTRVRTATIDRATDYGGPADHSPPPFAFRRFARHRAREIRGARGELIAMERVRNDSLRTHHVTSLLPY